MNKIQNNTCPLCKSQTQQYRLVAHNEHAFCVVNKEYLVDGHLMLIPKRHITSLNGLTSLEAFDVFNLIEEVLSILKKAYKKDSLVILNTGKHCSQEHIHFHVFPSNGGCRDLVSEYKNISSRPKRSEKDLSEQKVMLENFLN